MSKKSFTSGINSLIGGEPVKKENRGRPKTSTRIVEKSSQEGTKENETRATFIVNEDLLDKLKAMAYWDRVTIKKVINEALEDAILKYESNNGPIKEVPNK